MKRRRSSRRDFLKYGTAGALGLSLAKLPFSQALPLPRVTELLVFIGTYTTGKSKGIYHYRLNLTSGDLTFAGTTSPVRIRPFFPSLLTNVISTQSMKSINSEALRAARSALSRWNKRPVHCIC